MASRSSNKRHPILTTLLVLLLLVVAAGVIGYFATNKGKDLLPTLENVSMQTGNITPDSLKAQMHVQLRNHVPLGMTIDSFRYVTYIDGTAISRGAKDRPTTVKSKGVSTLDIPVNMDLSKVAHKIKTIQRDCVDVAITMDAYTRLPLLGTERIPIRASKRIYVPKLPHFEIADIDVTHLGLKDGRATITIKVTNYNPFPFTVKRVAYDFRISDDMQVKGVETKDVSFRKRGTTMMPIHVKFEPKAMPKVAFKTLFKAKKTPYRVNGSITVAAGKQNPKDSEVKFQSSGTLQDLKNIPK
ncbi:LEA type 2 family protein [Hymenobacter sp. GOD-10R]|uniref:LEA type 2 family protein n=1 Tax=Hymenobacter sp. GOD-10R TaxID=3093922 RepID=UPI002D7749D6|nr:LEA type 2 family protein [Hymenobacter sp. GOD-10R]WRQ28878.1 LEA type 2 family protein [Hymenobacter sp. GOD-10R]